MNSLLGIIAATGAAISFGAADFAGGLGSRRWSALGAATVVQLVSVPATLVVALVAGEAWSWQGVAIGLLAGLAAAVGLVALYAALASGTMGLVAGIAGVTVAAVTLASDAFLLELVPSPLQIVGVVCAVAAGLLATRGGWIATSAIMLAAVAGVAFGANFVIFDRGAALAPAPMWMLFGSRVAAGALLGVRWLLAERARPLRFGPLLLSAGVLDSLANGLMIQAIILIPVGIAASVGAVTPPVVTMLLAHIVLGESLPATGYLAFALATVGIILMLLGQQ